MIIVIVIVNNNYKFINFEKFPYSDGIIPIKLLLSNILI